jgi:O-antigen ligase
VLFLYLGVSLLWSPYPFISFKRWVRLVSAIVVAMVILTEGSPLEAFERILRRCAYVLIPLSLILINYYPHLGRGYGRWSGTLMWNGVALTKNALGQLCLMSSFTIVWAYLRDRRKENAKRNGTVMLTDGLILALAVYLIIGTPSGSYSATSIATLVLVTSFLFVLYKNESRAGGVARLVVWGMVFGWVAMISMESFVEITTSLLGREATLTGRTELWTMALEDAWQKPILGTGFGGYFNTGNEFTRTFGNTGHNGLLDVFVETGIVGILLLVVFLWSFYKKARAELDENFVSGVFAIGILVISILTNYTESIFLKSSSYIWNVTVFLSVISPEKYLDKIGNASNSLDR